MLCANCQVDSDCPTDSTVAFILSSGFTNAEPSLADELTVPVQFSALTFSPRSGSLSRLLLKVLTLMPLMLDLHVQQVLRWLGLMK
ncbi:hypothetical protein PoB_006827000 [Plakobranchus ocellatus]|uniref:Uncharacterized protein n=1 Tax=Plakobranchus ocellatus TaxID=259542 RepID=A0AAV4DCI9_9GAST|nr:hypothetical protein PoB_006827000 [Plakobranchus ocellatus]